MTASSFPLRFKDPGTKEMLRLVATQLGVPMNEIAEQAIRHELVLLGAAIDQQLTAVVQALRSYDPERDLARSLDAFAAGEARPDPLQATQIPPAGARMPFDKAAKAKPAPQRNPKLTGALAAFRQR